MYRPNCRQVFLCVSLYNAANTPEAIDIWSVGIMLLLFLTGKFPLFNAGDDIEALMEIATIMGMKRMEKIATLHSQ